MIFASGCPRIVNDGRTLRCAPCELRWRPSIGETAVHRSPETALPCNHSVFTHLDVRPREAHISRFAGFVVFMMGTSILSVFGCAHSTPEPALAEMRAPANTDLNEVLATARRALARAGYGVADMELRVDENQVQWKAWLSEYDRQPYFARTEAGKALAGKSMIVVYARRKPSDPSPGGARTLVLDGAAWVLIDKGDPSRAFVVRN